MHTRIFAGLLFALSLVSPAFAAPAAAPAEAEVVAPFHAFIDAFNKGDMKAAAAAYAPHAVIVDEIPPFLWRHRAFAHWSAALEAAWKEGGLTSGHLTLAAPTQFAAGTTMAYAIIPAHLTFTEKGKPASEDGTFTVTFKPAKQGWRISSWTWTTKH